MSSDKPEKVSTNPVSAGYSLLVRSLSKGNPTTMFSNTNASPPSQAPASPPVSPQASRTASSTSAETATSGLTAIEKFKNISARVTMQKETKPQWPPTSWMVSASHENIDKDKTSQEPVPPATGALGTDGGDAPEKAVEGDAGESASIARKIQDMFSSMSTSLPALPTSIYSSAPGQTPVPETTPPAPPSDSTPTPALVAPVSAPDVTPEQDPTPTPPPPPPAGVIDSKLAALLSSASVMNGSISKGRQSVWAALERLRAPKSSPSPSSPDTKDSKGTAAEEIEVEDDTDDDSSVMMYAPLVPDAGSEVEIARSEVSYVDQDGGVVGVAEEDWNARREVLAKERLDTLRRRKHEGKEKEKEEVAKEQAIKKGKRKEPKPKKVREVRVWVPSPTQLSFQATWWGYRLYLPPPVLDILGNKQLEAAKRAAMLTAALRWLLEHIPINLFPPQFRPVLMIVKRLGPYLGYIGSGIAWSWAGIKAFDKGNGVILTATWLMPVALIPGTWEEGMFDPPGPTTPPKDPVGSEPGLPPPSTTQKKDNKSSATTGKSR